jgi:HSP20 family protein
VKEKITMTMLRRWDPFREMMTVRNQMDRLLNDWWGESGDAGDGGTGFPLRLPLDVSESDDAFIVCASMPGIKPEELDISVQNNMLTIRGEMKQEEERQGERWHLQERRYGQFQRSIALPNNVDPNQVGAQYENGVLKLTLPKTEEAKPRKISVSSDGQQQSGNGQQQSAQRTIEGQAQQRS